MPRSMLNLRLHRGIVFPFVWARLFGSIPSANALAAYQGAKKMQACEGDTSRC